MNTDSLFTAADSLGAATTMQDSFALAANRYMALLKKTINIMEPIVQAQIQIISVQKLLGNISIVALGGFTFVMYMMVIKQFSRRRRWIISFIIVWTLLLASFNIIPGWVLNERIEEQRQWNDFMQEQLR